MPSNPGSKKHPPILYVMGHDNQGRDLFITGHAVDRWISRVQKGISDHQAIAAILSVCMECNYLESSKARFIRMRLRNCASVDFLGCGKTQAAVVVFDHEVARTVETVLGKDEFDGWKITPKLNANSRRKGRDTLDIP